LKNTGQVKIYDDILYCSTDMPLENVKTNKKNIHKLITMIF